MIPFRLHAIVLALAPTLIASAQAVDYLREVKPLLTEHCVSCHDGAQQKSGLRLDTAAAARLGGDHGAGLVPGNPQASLVMQAIEGAHADLPRMPYKRPPMDPEEIEVIRRWIESGASAPADEKPGIKVHWAFVPPQSLAPPNVRRADWVRNPIDQFILARLEAAGLEPAVEADRSTLLRRLSLDLTGLPPTPEEVDAFLADARTNAYERAVERLLASPHYGERWGRHWLDVARYADSNGYSIDAPRSIWPWRDWVIRALNEDKPFDEFVIEQLAGDLIAETADLPEPEKLPLRVATGFHRNTQINEEGGIDPEQFRIESVLDRVNTTGTAFMGLTVSCAQCHDHKFDPISQREYFQLFAFFNNQDEPNIEAASPEEFAARDAARSAAQPLQAALEARAETLKPQFAAWEASLTLEAREKLPLEVRNALGLLPEQRSEKLRATALKGFYQTDADYRSLERRWKESLAKAPAIPTTMALSERKTPRESYIFIKGDFTRRGPDVAPGTPAVLPPLRRAASGEGSSTDSAAGAIPTRLDLARWLVDSEHPLTARVQVNRVWQQYFGRGIVETENDFGTQGIPPTHPELLDWLAREFVKPSYDREATPWSLKSLHRLIVTSAAYRQSSRARPELQEKDPTNRLLARQNRLRLDAEVIRDVALAVSGRLNPRIGGPSVFPPQPDGVMNLGQSRREWKPSEGEDRYRRGIYTYFWRATPHPALTVFDAPDAFSSCTRRIRSNTPLQALTLLNDAAYADLARALADRIRRGPPAGDRIEHAFRLSLARPPKPTERESLQKLWNDELRDGNEEQAWVAVARVLLNLDETITRE